MSEPVLEALRRALGARWVRVIPKGSGLPEEQQRGRRREVHHLTVDVRGKNAQLVCAMPRLPSVDDTHLAGAVARSLEPKQAAPQPAGSSRLDAALATFSEPAERRAEAVLGAALRLAGAGAGGLAIRSDETRAWTHGPGRPILRRAAIAAVDREGRLGVGDRTFLAVTLAWNGATFGGLALEDAQPSENLRLFALVAAAALRPAETVAAPQPEADSRDDIRAVLATIPMPAVAVDSAGNLLGASPEAEGLFGLVADFDLGMPVAGRLGSRELESTVLGGTGGREVVVKDHTFEASVVPLASGGRVVALRDRTHEETMERLQEDLVASVAHELRTPIAAVKGLVQLLTLRASKLAPEKLVALLGDGEREIARLERLVEDLLLAARVATGGIVAQPDAIDLAPLARDVIKHASPRYDDRQFIVQGDAEAYADPALVRHAIWHLVDNAAKFGPQNGKVTVKIGKAREGPEVHVEDEGEGIYSGDIPELFRRFRQLDPSATRQHGGAGLGLFLVKAVLDAQNGTVWVKSRLGKGSTFSFRLPPVPDDL